MENEWGEGPASRCVGTVWRSTADDTTRSEAGYCGKMLRRERVRKPEGEICPAIRRRATDRGGSRRVFLLWRVVSCGDAALRWRTKLHLDSGEPLDDRHRPTTLGARPKIARTGGGGLLLGLRCPSEQLEAKWQGRGPLWVGREAAVAGGPETFPGQGQKRAA